eukprot:TRINITY_DN67968_c1_g1_i1.p1 TRINITY_DN67968_c1_g1~~TRINITY_DN67968_c1_g1_i1.p1  ORF type:complete len:460 (-),score=56.07 TRINITY_DN67968_c1_g1_i1:775-2154(-)
MPKKPFSLVLDEPEEQPEPEGPEFPPHEAYPTTAPAAKFQVRPFWPPTETLGSMSVAGKPGSVLCADETICPLWKHAQPPTPALHMVLLVLSLPQEHIIEDLLFIIQEYYQQVVVELPQLEVVYKVRTSTVNQRYLLKPRSPHPHQHMRFTVKEVKYREPGWQSSVTSTDQEKSLVKQMEARLPCHTTAFAFSKSSPQVDAEHQLCGQPQKRPNWSASSLSCAHTYKQVISKERRRHIQASDKRGDTPVYMSVIEEWMHFGSVADLLNQTKVIPTKPLAAILKQVTAHLVDAHQHKMIVTQQHSMQQGVLINAGAEVKLAMTLDILGHDPLDDRGPVRSNVLYLSPERLFGNAYGRPADIYALGVLAHSCATGLEHPYNMTAGNHFFGMIEAVQADQFNYPPTLDNTCADFIRQCLVRDTEQRATAASLMEHPFVRDAALTDLVAWLETVDQQRLVPPG